MKEEHRKGKRAYLNDFHKNSEGRYEYRGHVFTWDGDAGEFARVKRNMWLVYAVVIVCGLACGFIPDQGLTGTFYVVLPYALSLMGAISLGWALCRLSTAGMALKEYIYDVTVKKLPHRAMLTVVLSICTILGAVIYTISSKMAVDIIYLIIFCVLELAVCGGAVIIYKMVGNFRWQKSSKNAGNKPKNGAECQEPDGSGEA